MNPLFSIITVTYNAESTLRPTLESVGEQTCRLFEYIVMDGNSTDKTVELARNSGIPQIKIVSEPDNGLYDAMNKAMAIATGDYLIFLNAGDSFAAASTLETLSNAVMDNDYPGIVYGQTRIVNSNRQYIADRHLKAPEQLTFNSFANGMVVCHQAFVALRKLAPAYDTSFRYSADYDWCIRILQRSRRNHFIPETIINYLGEGLTTANRRKSLIERFRIMCRYYGVWHTIINHLRFIPRFIKRSRLEKNLELTN
ncbi:MAG: glycosyltransferase [Muribaculaceae bacterium]|nr:glycosyltransferase [Muribaculaceae bacterium]